MTMIDDVQARLDSYKTNKQRRLRMKEIRRIFQERGGAAPIEFAIEMSVLMMRLEKRQTVTAKEASDYLYSGAASGKLPTHVTIDGEDRHIPPEAYRLPH